MAESTVGPWAKDKLDRLRKYLHAYTTIMKDQAWCKGYFYIDAFAGPGDHEVKLPNANKRNEAQQILIDVSQFGGDSEEQQAFLAGSPRVALDIEFPFTDYIFIEQSAARTEALQRIMEEYGSTRRIHIRRENCTHYLRDKIAVNPKLNWKENRAIVFLDPFGMQVGWQTITDLAATNAIEIFLNFPVGMAIQRLLLKKAEHFTEAKRRKLDEYFGSPDWLDTLYKSQRGLFGEQIEKVEDSGAALVKWYRDRLRTVFPHVSHAALIRNTQGGHLYYLMLASHNATGMKIANNILSAGEVV